MELKLLSCPLCLKPHFQGVDALRSSLITVATSPLACPVCNELLMGLDKLTIHLFSHITNNIVQETYSIDQTNIPPASCKATGDHLMEVDRNQEAIDAKRVSDKQQKMEKTKGTFAQRVDSKEKKNCLRCDICNFCFNDEHILEIHQKLLHQTSIDKKTGSYSYHCHLCTKKFKMRGSLMVHLRVAHYGFGHHSEDHDCHRSPNDSPQTSNSIAQANLHLDTETKDKVLYNQYSSSGSVVIVESNDVNMCSNSEESKSGNTKDNKQWECDVCSKMFTTKYFLKKHKRLHTGEMPYFCSLCNKSFTFQQSYHKHMLYHTSEKPHVCNECGRAFKELSTLHNHERIHSGERPFACETCGKCFRQRVSYLVHKRIHTGVMPYKCTACDKSFRYKVSQRSHKCTANPPGTVIRAPELPSSPTLRQNSNQEANSAYVQQSEHNKNKRTANTTAKCIDVPEFEDCKKLEPPKIPDKTTNKAPQNSSGTCKIEMSQFPIKTEVKELQVTMEEENSKALAFNMTGEIIAQNFSFVPGCEILAVHQDTGQGKRVDKKPILSQEEEHPVGGYPMDSNVSNHSLDLEDQPTTVPYETPDFFSMVLSPSPPMLPDVQSLHLHSPKDKQDDHEHMLATINEESLKELLYGPTN